LLTVDLSEERVEQSDLPESLVRRFLGGRGINAWLLAKNLGPEVDPLGPENVLVLSCGLLTGTEAPASSRLHVGARSPLTGLLGSSNVGGHFGAALRAAGYQAVVVRGRASRPVLLWIGEEDVELRDAGDLWGLDSRDAAERIRSELGDGVRLFVIGPGGENRVRYACIMTGTRHAAGRTGMGAVMGSKNLKAIVVSAPKGRPKADPRARQVVRAYLDRIRNAPRYEIYARYSNSAFVEWADEMGLLATQNYQRVRFEGASRIDGKRLIDYVTRPRSCYRCPVHCKAEIEIKRGRYAGTRGERPDIEPIVNLGAKCGLDDPEALLYLYNLAGDLGLDAISVAGVLAFAMELYERGIVTERDTDGVRLTWGNAEAMEAMMRRIARREGFGAVLAEGVQRAARLIGRGAEAYALHVKGMELTAYDPRGALGSALGYAVSTRGGDWTSVYALPELRWDPEEGREWFGTEKAVDRLAAEGKGALVKRTMAVSAVIDSLGMCKVPILSVLCDFRLENEAELVAALTGWEVSGEELALVGERILNLERLFDLRLGAKPEDDDLPDRFTEERVTDPGPTQGMVVDIQKLVGDFYTAMGWDAEGRPTLEKLRELGLEDFAGETAEGGHGG
jgi:aldehyde:ferredoxin oxidoreductase